MSTQSTKTIDESNKENMVKHREASLISESNVFVASDNVRILERSQDPEKAMSSGTASEDDEDLVRLSRRTMYGRTQTDSNESRYLGMVMTIQTIHTIGLRIVG
jgi:hypothetical protein